MTDFLIFDFETLSNKPTSAPIISIGAICGNWEDKLTVDSLRETGFYRNVDPVEQVSKLGLSTTKSTLDWWSKQGEEAQKVLKAKDKISVKQALSEFHKWCVDSGVNDYTMVYIRAPHFDYTIYENLCELVGLDLFKPFSHWKIRDTRSIIDTLYDVKNGYAPGFKDVLMPELKLIEHNSLDDCIKEYYQLRPDYLELIDDIMTLENYND